jgi:probable rRNA maturation factor
VGSRPTGRRRPGREVLIAFAGDRRALAPGVVRSVVGRVLDGERAGDASVTVTFLSAARMRVLNRRTFGRDRATDVIAFGLPHDEQLVGDVYICPSVARQSARRYKVPVREELIRLVVHGTLHVLGRDHDGGDRRELSLMWRRQEDYVTQVVGSTR